MERSCGRGRTPEPFCHCDGEPRVLQAVAGLGAASGFQGLVSPVCPGDSLRQTSFPREPLFRVTALCQRTPIPRPTGYVRSRTILMAGGGGGPISPIGPGARSGRIIPRMAMPGGISPTHCPAPRPTAGARMASPGSVTGISCSASHQPFGMKKTPTSRNGSSALPLSRATMAKTSRNTTSTLTTPPRTPS